MITFKKGSKFICNPVVEEVDSTVRELASKAGITIYGGSRDFKQYPNLMWNGSGVYGTSTGLENTEYEKVSLDEFIQAIKRFENITVKLTDDYSAVLEEDGIHVGCQIISYDTFGKLVELVNKRGK